MYCRNIFSILIFILYFFISSSAQPLSSFQHYTFLSDFPQNTVQAIFQDKKGYIWVGTESGLNRYDGKRILNYKLGFNDNFTLTGKVINNIAEDQQQNLWVATNNGLTLFAPGSSIAKNKSLAFIAEKINNSLESRHVECIKILQNGKVVIGFNTGLCIYDPVARSIKVTPTLNFNGSSFAPFIVSLQEDMQGNIIAVTNKHGIYILDTGMRVARHIPQTSFEKTDNFLLHNSVYLPGNKLFIATNKGLYNLHLNSISLPQKIKDQKGIPLSTLQFNCLAYDPFQNIILAGSNTSGVITLDTAGLFLDQLIDNNISRKLQSNNIFYLLVDRAGLGYWVGNGKGLVKFFYEEDKFATREIYDGTGSPMRVYPIYTENNTEVLIGTDRFLMKMNTSSGQLSKIELEKNLEVRYNYIYKAGEKLYLFCTKSGLYYADNILQPQLKKISLKYPELSSLDSANILCAYRVNENQLLFGTREVYGGGMIRWNINEKSIERFITDPGDNTSISNNTVNYITRALSGEIIVCTNEGVCYFDNATSKFSRILMPGEKGINYPQVNALLAEKDVLWVGTYGGGLNKFNIATGKMEYITEKEGLASNDIYTIYRGLPDHLWMSTNEGIVFYNTRTGKIRNYNKGDGLLNNEFNRTSSFKHGDTLYFGGISGIQYFNYKKIAGKTFAPVADITKISLINGGVETNLFPDDKGQLTLNYTDNTLKMYLASPFYINAGKTSFFYRLLPNQAEWISNGTNNELVISQLPPGKHIIELKSVNSEAIESSNIKAIYLNILPPWFQTTWFRLVIILLIAFIIFLFFWLRISQLKKENKIRNQLASDLHDDLGSTLNSIKVYTNLAQIEKGNPTHFAKIKESTQDAIAGVRDMIWVLDDKKDTVQDMLFRINQFAAPLCEANQIVFTQNIEEQFVYYKLDKEEKRNLFMILKEGINNSIKYCNCGTIRLIVEGERNKIKFLIQDDGIGFEKEKITAGHGLKNMVNRAKAISYKFTLDSSPGNGTIILLEKK